MLTRNQAHTLATGIAMRTWEKLRKQYPSIQVRYPKVIIDNRLKVTAGLAYCEETPQYVRLSLEFMMQHPKVMCDVIIPHEMAHLAAFTAYGDNGHGDGWASVMEFLGLPAEEYHTMTNYMHVDRMQQKWA